MILFILDIEKQQKQLEKTAFFYLLVSLFCALFGGVYEYFSHEVYSNCMIYAFFIPLAGECPCFTAPAFPENFRATSIILESPL